ncbi:hypothetical protein L195_g060929, partial [Trifolium pratense]
SHAARDHFYAPRSTNCNGQELLHKGHAARDDHHAARNHKSESPSFSRLHAARDAPPRRA